MKYIVDVNGRRHEVDLGDDAVREMGPQAPSLGSISGTPIALLALGDARHRVHLLERRGKGRYLLWVDGYPYEVEALDERRRAIRDLTVAQQAGAGPAPLRAPMPGLIVRVVAQVGERVEVGQGLVVMEAMKMENELRAQAAGTVTAIHVTAGNAVEKGALLIEIG